MKFIKTSPCTWRSLKQAENDCTLENFYLSNPIRTTILYDTLRKDMTQSRFFSEASLFSVQITRL